MLAADVTLNADALNGLNLLLSVGLPLLVGVVTKQVTKPEIKRNLLYLFSALTGTITTIVENGGHFDVTDTLLGIVVSYAVAQGSYSAVLKPSGAAELVAKTSDKIGVGVTIAADPTAVALAEGTVVPAPAVVPAEQVVDTEGKQAEVIADAAVDEPEPAEEEEPEPPYDVDVDPDVAVIDADALPAEDPDA